MLDNTQYISIIEAASREVSGFFSRSGGLQNWLSPRQPRTAISDACCEFSLFANQHLVYVVSSLREYDENSVLEVTTFVRWEGTLCRRVRDINTNRQIIVNIRAISSQHQRVCHYPFEDGIVKCFRFAHHATASFLAKPA